MTWSFSGVRQAQRGARPLLWLSPGWAPGLTVEKSSVVLWATQRSRMAADWCLSPACGREAKIEGPEGQDHLWLHSELEATLGYPSLCLQNKPRLEETVDKVCTDIKAGQTAKKIGDSWSNLGVQ